MANVTINDMEIQIVNETSVNTGTTPPESKACSKFNDSDFYARFINEAPFLHGDHKIQHHYIATECDWANPELIKEGQRFFRKSVAGVQTVELCVSIENIFLLTKHRVYFHILYSEVGGLNTYFEKRIAHRDNFLSFGVSGAVCLLMGLSLRRMCGLILQSGYFHIRENSLRRWLRSFHRITLWLESDLFERISKGSIDIYHVRKMHAAAAKSFDKNAPLPDIPPLSEKNVKLLNALHKDLECYDDSRMPHELLLDYHPDDPMTQMDMGLAHFVFFGYFIFYAREFGATNDAKGLEGFVHIWAIIGRFLGIEDRFNPALHWDDEASQRKILKDLVLAGFKHSDKYTMTIWNTSVETFRWLYATPFLTTASVVNFFVNDIALKEYQGKRTEFVSSEMSIFDRVCYNLLKLFFYLLGNMGLFRVCVNATSRFGVRILSKLLL